MILVKDIYIPRWQMFFNQMRSPVDNFNEEEVLGKIRIKEEEWASNLEMPEATFILTKYLYK